MEFVDGADLAAYRAQQDYLHNRDKELGRLKQRLDAAKQK